MDLVLNESVQTHNTWNIPLSYITQKNRSTIISEIFYANQSVHELEIIDFGSWIKFNVNQTGYYRVNYSVKLWSALIRQLKDDASVFSPVDRANLIDDAFSFVRANWTNVNITLPLSLIQYAKDNEESYTTWQVILEHLQALLSILNGYKTRINLQNYIQGFIKPIINEVGCSDKRGSLQETKKQQVILKYAIALSQEDAVARGRELFNEWKIEGRVLPKNLQPVVYIAGVQHGNKFDWKYVHKKYKQELVPSIKDDLLAALCATTDPNLLSMMLRWSQQDEKIKLQDSFTIIHNIGKNSAGHLLAWNFFVQQWDNILCRYKNNKNSISKLFSYTTSLLNTIQQYNEALGFLKKKMKGQLPQNMQHSLEEILWRAIFANHNHATIHTWLEQTALTE